MHKPEEFIHMSILVLPHQVASVYALLGASALTAFTAAQAGNVAIPRMTNRDATELAEKIAAVPTTVAAPEPAVEVSGDTAEASPPATDTGNVEIDAHGHPWSAELHASTKGKTKEGLWRMKPGAERPAPMPGFPVTADPAEAIAELGSTSTASTGETASSPSEAAPTPAATPAADDDEFAAFRAASEKMEAEAAETPIPARKWTDADLSALCNQAAQKLGDPVPVKELIAQFVPAGEVSHSRNIPEATRADFAAAVEAKAGIKFAG